MPTIQIPIYDKYRLTNTVALVDADNAYLLKYRWHVNEDGYPFRCQKTNQKYAVKMKYLFVKMHLDIMGRRPDLVVDHINGVKLDNRRCNLRFVTNQQNCQNKRGATVMSKSGIRGVSYNPKRNLRWYAQVSQGGRHIIAKWFGTCEEAATAVRDARKHAGFPCEAEEYHEKVRENDLRFEEA